MEITSPTLLVKTAQALRNIKKMQNKAKANNLIFRPHFKTHNSNIIGYWFKDLGINKITVSSLKMAEYFADYGWKDITVAIPFNYKEHVQINCLADYIALNLLAVSDTAVTQLDKKLSKPVGIFIEIDTGYNRTGIKYDDFESIDKILNVIIKSEFMGFRGFLIHSGNTYHSKNLSEIQEIHNFTVTKMNDLKNRYIAQFPKLILSIGDTPSCSQIDDLTGVDEIRPGNFVFYDLMQYYLNSCKIDEISLFVACPVIAVYPERNEVVIHGGAVHFSKEFQLVNTDDGNSSMIYGKVCKLNDEIIEINNTSPYIKSLSQEHGIIKADDEFCNKINIGDVLTVIPVHSCLTKACMGEFAVI